MYQRVIAPAVAVALLALLGWMAYEVVRPFLVAIGWGAAITVVTFPAYAWLRRKLGGRSGVAAALMVLGIVVLLVAPTVTLMTSLSRQAAELYPKLEQLASRENPLLAVRDRLESYKEHPVLGGAAGRIGSFLSSSGDVRSTLSDFLKKAIGGVTGMVTAALSNVLAFLLNLLLTLAALGIFYTRGEALLEEATSLLPLREERGRELMSRLGTVTRAVVKGVGLTCIAQGALGGLGWWVAGLPSPLLFGTVMAFGSLVPVVGTMIVWLPGALYLLFTGKTAAGIGLILWGALAVGNIDNVLRPLLVGGNIGIPMPLLIVGILGGLVAFGLSGLVLGPLSIAALLFVLEEYHLQDAAEGAPPPPAG